MKIAYVGLDLFLPALETLIELGEDILCVFTCEVDNEYEFNLDIINTAKRHRIPYTTERITRKDIDLLSDKGCDLLICGAYYHKIPISDRLPMVNIHPSLLPNGRGSWPMPISILRGERTGGVTLHKLAQSFDTGDIIMQRTFEMDEKEDLESLTEKIRRKIPPMMRELIADFPALYDRAVPQGEGEYLACPDPSQYVLSRDTELSRCDTVLRAFAGFECIYERPDHGRVGIFHGRTLDRECSGALPVNGGCIIAERIRELPND